MRRQREGVKRVGIKRNEYVTFRRQDVLYSIQEYDSSRCDISHFLVNTLLSR